MFLAMALLIFDTSIVKKCRCPPYVIGGTARGWGLYRLVAIPALCDLSATILQNIALLYLVPSIWQMFRGSILLFTALLACFYRHQKLRFVDWLGVIVTILGITIVGLSSVVRKNKADNTTSTANAPLTMQLVAMLLIVIAQGLQAFQTIVEEQLLHDVDATESEIVAFEGLWGLYFSTFLTMPIANIVPQEWGEGLFEQSLETFKMLFSSWQLGVLALGYCAAILGLNQTGMMITSFSTAIHRNIYEALRSIAVWALSAIVYYIWPKSGAGEKLDWWSFLQAFGFLVSIFGTFIYNRVIKFPCLYYADDSKATEQPLIEAVPTQGYVGSD
jgi:drug/metabolite transporter (DMT)-like permease